MRKSIKKFVALLAATGICLSFAFTVQADAYDHIGFDYMQSAYAKGATQQLSITAYDGSGDVVAFSGDVTYSSSNENVVTVNAGGLMTMVNYGIATVTATSGGKSASMLVTVTNNTIAPAISYTPGSNSEPTTGFIVRKEARYYSGFGRLTNYSFQPVGGEVAIQNADDHDYQYMYANTNPLLGYAPFRNADSPVAIPANGVIEAWFFDNGNNTNSEVAIYMSAYSNDTVGTKAVGVIDASNTNYQVTGNVRRMRNSGQFVYGPRTGFYVDSGNLMPAATNTDIPRTKGWHQVMFVRRNADASATLTDGASNQYTKTKSTVYDIYLDGQHVARDTTDRSGNEGTGNGRAFAFINGYAGRSSTNTAYIADIAVHQYINVEDTALSESSGTYTIDNTYYGTTGAQTKSYKWQVSDDGKTGWTDIAGVTSQSFTPSVATYGDKFIRGGVKVATSVETAYYFTDASYIFNGTYQHISLGKNTSYYTKGSTNNQLSLVGYARDMTERNISDMTGAVFTSSNENVVTVTNAGVLSAVDYGISTVTATYQGLSASMLITVTNRTITGYDNRNEGNYSEGHGRLTNYSYKPVGGTIPIQANGSDNDYRYECANRNPLLHYAGYANYNNAAAIPANGVIEAWFYDNGNNTDSEVALYMSAYSNDTDGTKAVGVINSDDTTYKVTGNSMRMKKNENTWVNGGDVVLYAGNISAATDTGIQRTKGWHQIVFVRMNEDVTTDPTLSDGPNGNYTKPKSMVYDIYLDGQHVARDSSGRDGQNGTGRVFSFLYGYAGFNSTNTAYIADVSAHQYIDIDNATITESNSTFTINHTYYGTTGAKTQSYKWQMSDDGLTGWTDIAGATGQTYTPTVNTRNKYVRGLVSVSTSAATTGYRNSGSARPNFSLISATSSANQVDVALRIVNDTGASIPYALLIGYYNNADTEIVAFDSEISTVASGSNKTTHTFTIPEEVRGNFSKAKIFLWENVNQITPYTQDILVE